MKPARLLEDARGRVEKPALLPVRPVLTPPGTGLVRRLEGHEDWVRAVALTADGTRAVSGGDDGTLRLWDLERGAEMRRLEGHEGVVRAVAVTADGRRAVSGGHDGTLRLWDLERGVEIAAFSADNAILCSAMEPGGQGVVVGDTQGRVYVLRIED